MSAWVDVLTSHPVGDADLRAALRLAHRGRGRDRFVVAGVLGEHPAVDVVHGERLAMRLALPCRRTTAAGVRWVLPVILEVLDEATSAASWEALWRLAHRFDGILLLEGEPVGDQGLREPDPAELVVVGGPPSPPRDAGPAVRVTATLEAHGDPREDWRRLVAAVLGWAPDLLGPPAWWNPLGEWVVWESDDPPPPPLWPIGVDLATADGRTTWHVADDLFEVTTHAPPDVATALRERREDLAPWALLDVREADRADEDD